MSREATDMHARSDTNNDLITNKNRQSDAVRAPVPHELLDDIAAGLGSHNDSLLFSGSIFVLCFLVFLIGYAQSLYALAFLGFAALCLPYRVASFVARKWTFFLVDFCYVSMSM